MMRWAAGTGDYSGLWALIVAGLIVLLLFLSWARPFGLVGMVLSWGS